MKSCERRRKAPYAAKSHEMSAKAWRNIEPVEESQRKQQLAAAKAVLSWRYGETSINEEIMKYNQ